MTILVSEKTDRLLAVVPTAALRPEQGAAVLLPGGTSAAVFLLHDGSLHAVGNIDPFYGAPVICHGIVGDRAGAPTVASPLGKQVFCLRTGRCLDDPSASLPVFEVTAADDGVIHLSMTGNNREIPVGQS
ncbi:MAG: nitrite reductase (NAD(P)H) small subunit [Nocardiopsaceae bacterium]|nr:nitrite reductase (NAD(P)H) small subunit [Nocardiopsaceae bacterium]